MASAMTPRRLRPHRIDLVLVATALIMAALTVVLVADPSLRVIVVDRTLDVATTLFTALAAVGLALLTMPRYRETGRLTLQLQTMAYVLLASFSTITLVFVLLKLDGRLGMTRGLPEQLPLWVAGLTRVTVSALFFAAGWAAVRELRARLDRAWGAALLPVLALAVVAVIAYPLRDLLPSLIGPEGMEVLIADPGTSGRLPDISPLTMVGAAGTVVLLGAGAILFRTSYVERGAVSEQYLAIGLIVFAFADLHYAFYPSIYTGLVTASDAFRLVAYGVLLLGINAEQREDLRALRAAYTGLDRLRVTEADRAALEERSRLAREIHDGLAQQLWFAKLKFERLAGSLPEEAKPLAGEVGQALDLAIVEARQAMATMRSSLEADLPLTDMLERAVDDFGGRSGLQVQYTPSPGLPAAMPPRQQIELLRVVQEALTNVSKHADATVVRVRAEVIGRDLLVAVADNGRGFDPRTAPDQGLGLRGMEERARLMGGSLRVDSEPHGGTTVELSVPLMTADWLPPTGSAPGDAGGAPSHDGAAPVVDSEAALTRSVP